MCKDSALRNLCTRKNRCSDSSGLASTVLDNRIHSVVCAGLAPGCCVFPVLHGDYRLDVDMRNRWIAHNNKENSRIPGISDIWFYRAVPDCFPVCVKRPQL